MERQTRCLLSWEVALDRTGATLQRVVVGVPNAFQYCSDGHAAYAGLNYHRGFHLVAPGKSQTYAVEAVNAELRHYLARLARRTRCFSKRLPWLRRLVKLFVHYWNLRQLHCRAYPRYRPALVSFVTVHV